MLKHIGVLQFLLPVDVQDALQVPHLETVEFPFLLFIGGSQESAEHTGLEYTRLGLVSQDKVVPAEADEVV